MRHKASEKSRERLGRAGRRAATFGSGGWLGVPVHGEGTGHGDHAGAVAAATIAAAIATLWSLPQGGPMDLLSSRKWASMSSMPSASLAASNTCFGSYQWTAQPRASAAAASALRYITQSATFRAR